MRLLVVALAAVLALLATSRFQSGIRLPLDARLLSSTITAEVPTLEEETHGCNRYPTLRVKEVLHNNLAAQGPDVGEEGIMYRVEDPVNHGDFDMVIHALGDSDFKVFDPHKAGLWGQNQAINMMPGGRIHARFSFRSSRTKQPVKVPALAITFFDFDEESPGFGREILQVHKGWFDYVVEASSSLNITRTGSDLRFEGTVMGSGPDNPVDAEHLTEEQARKAVSLSYRNVHSFNVTMSTTPGNWPRFFVFVARASLLCKDVRIRSRQRTEFKGQRTAVKTQDSIQRASVHAVKKTKAHSDQHEHIEAEVDDRDLHQDSGEAKPGGPGLMLPIILTTAVAAACLGVLGFFVMGRDSLRDMRVEPHELVSLRLVDLDLEEEERAAAEAAEAERLAKVPKLMTIFESPDGETRKSVTFFSRPLSVSCQLWLPMLVESVVAKSEADTAGIQRGWVLCEFGPDASNMRKVLKSGDDTKFQEAYEQLLLLTKRLPQSK